MNMKQWINSLKNDKVKKAMPVLSFPSIQLMGIGVNELISNSDLQAEGMKIIADKTNAYAAVSMMDLSVEAETFGSEIRFDDHEVPTVIGNILNTMEDVEKLEVPKVGAGRTGRYIEAIGKAAKLITDRPVLAGVIGPFSLAGRLLGVSDAMLLCYDEPEMVALALEKVTEFLTKYILAYKEIGAHGVVIAEPLAGLLTPALNAEFSVPYVKSIIDAVQDEDFVVIYHNCGGGTLRLIDEILSVNASAYHFGNAIDMTEMIKLVPKDTLIMGNIDPASQFCNGTPESVREVTNALLEKIGDKSNFVISSGCDVPPLASWDNINEFFNTVDEYYAKKA